MKPESDGLTHKPAMVLPAPHWSANSFIAHNEAPGTVIPSTMTQKGAAASQRVSGRVISAIFCVPHSIRYRRNGGWVRGYKRLLLRAGVNNSQDLQPRRGTSALFDSLSYLSSNDSSWDHTVVGWTGEIKYSLQDTLRAPNLNAQPLNSASAPVPINGQKRTTQAGQADEIILTKRDREKLEHELARDDGGKVVPVWLYDAAEHGSDVAVLKNQSRWRRYAEHELYTLFHYKQHEPTDGRAERLWWADYYCMNESFADRILEIYKPGDLIWIHDYHLCLVPSMLRQRLPHIHIGFFLHIPFPSSEYLRCLSHRKEILEGILGSNLIGFQSFGYARHFDSCCQRILGFDGSSPTGVFAYGVHVAFDVFPIGIHVAAIQQAAFEDPEVDEKIHGIRELYSGKKIIVGRDRLDSVRGVAQKLQAFELFLDRYPEWRNKVVLIQVTSPTSIEEEKENSASKISNKISDLVAKINGTYGSLSFSPVQHYPQYISRQEYFALLRVADVGLITSVRDGMNTTSLEYVVCQKEHCGPLILSEFSGTAGSLKAALQINPWDLSGVAESIDTALRMSLKDRQLAHNKLYDYVTTNTVEAWTEQYLTRLKAIVSTSGKTSATPLLDKTALLNKLRGAKRRLFMLDYDGTLTPIVKDPQAAIPSDRVLRTLKKLAADSKNAVWIISGRDQAFLNEWMGHIPELGLSAEHGSFIRQPLEKEWENMTTKTDMGWQKDVLSVFQHYTDKTQGSFIERKRVAVTWHYRCADPEYGRYQAKECQKQLESTVTKNWDVEVMNGKANLEVRPTFVNKGEIAKRLIASYGKSGGKDSATVHGRPDFVLCSGDDFTDEDMFRALNNSDLPKSDFFSVTVGPSSRQTLADWHVLEPSDLISTLGMLTGSVDDACLGAVAVVDSEVPESRS